MMDKRLTVIYADAAEKFVKNVVLYANDGGALYYDEARTEAVNGAVVQDLFFKGLLIISDNAAGGYYIPTSYSLSPDNEAVVYCAETEYTNPIVNEEEAE